MNIDEQLEQIVHICAELQIVITNEGDDLTDNISEVQMSTMPLRQFIDLKGDNSVQFKKYLEYFRCERLFSSQYVQWSSQVYEHTPDRLRFYLGASGTAAYAVVKGDIFAGIEEMNPEDDFVLHYETVAQWLQDHSEMYIASYSPKDVGEKKSWWKFWQH